MTVGSERVMFCIVFWRNGNHHDIVQSVECPEPNCHTQKDVPEYIFRCLHDHDSMNASQNLVFSEASENFLLFKSANRI